MRLGEVPIDLKPNRQRAEIYFKDDEKELLPTTDAAKEHTRTIDQMLSALGQQNFIQGRLGNQLLPEDLKEDQIMSDASDCSVCPLPVPVTIQIPGQ